MIYAVHKRTKEHRIVPRLDVLSNADWRYVEADADGWIKWSGGECPLPESSTYEIKIIDGTTQQRCGASKTAWDSPRLTAYRPILNQAEQPKEWRGPEDGMPPAGVVCNIGCFINGQWAKQEFDYRIDYIGKSVVVASTVGTAREVERVFKEQVQFYAIRTDRERWIEAADAVTMGEPSKQEVLRIIYDAGLARLPD